MFSKALFKQSYKANRVMWFIITFAVCFMLACVMVISGGGDIAKVKNAIQDTVIQGEINSQMENRSINYYNFDRDGLGHFDNVFVFGIQFDTWATQRPKKDSFGLNDSFNNDTYLQAMQTWKNLKPSYTENSENPLNIKSIYEKDYLLWLNQQPVITNYETKDLYLTDLATWENSCPKGNELQIPATYLSAVNSLKAYMLGVAQSVSPFFTPESKSAQEILATAMYALNPNNMFDNFYTSHNEPVPPTYDIATLTQKVSDGTINDYLVSEERTNYINNRSKDCASIFLAGNMTSDDTVNLMLAALSKFGVTKEKYDSFGYTYNSIKHIAYSTVLSYDARYNYEYKELYKKYTNGEFENLQEFETAIQTMNTNLTKDLTVSLLASLPSDVSVALEEIGQMDLFSLIVGSIFFKMAGLLLPIIYVIMVSNNLVAGQVDSGSMAYVLSTGTKRKQVTCTQALFLVGSLFLMFCCTTLTSVICLAAIGTEEIALTYGQLILLNVGAFIAIFAVSGICFLSSCWFDRSRRSMAIGGGLSMFFLVATMLGLFGSEVIPSVVRLDALNTFNYVTILSFFDVPGILSGGLDFIWKLAILLVIGVLGYVIGAIKFRKKDLPL